MKLGEMWKLLILLLYIYYPVINGARICRSPDEPTLLNGKEKITTPNYPGRYRPWMDCYISRFSSLGGLRIKFTHVDLEAGHDYVEIYEKRSKDEISDGEVAAYSSEKTSGDRQIFSGKEIILGSQVTLYFHSSPMFQYTGLEFTIETYVTSLGYHQPIRHVPIPPKSWYNTPALTRVSTNVYDVLGREVHMSSVLTLLTEKKHNINFPVHQTVDGKINFELTIRGDTIYLDENNLTFEGLKKLTIYARRLVADTTATLLINAPAVCYALNGEECEHLKKAYDTQDGRNGKPGLDTPEINMFVYQIYGNIVLSIKASDGTHGEDGGAGGRGKDNTSEAKPANSCTFYCISKGGFKGPPGYPGEHGRRGGDPGVGGSISDISVKVVQANTGYIKLEQTPGKGGGAASHGHGGPGGHGGRGGCGMDCHMRMYPSFDPHVCMNVNDCGKLRGPPGDTGPDGIPGANLYPFILPGDGGSKTAASITTVDSLIEEFAHQPDLLKLIKRKGEFLMQRNENEEAEDIFNFIVSTSQPDSKLYKEASEKLRNMHSGFDYYGNDKTYAPDLDWSYLNTRTTDLLETGQSFEDAYNRVQQDISDITRMNEAIHSFAKVSIQSEDRALASKESQLNSKKDLFFGALRQMEQTMNNEAFNMKQLLVKAIIDAKAADAQKQALEVLDWVGGITAFAASAASEDIPGAISAATSMIKMAAESSCNVPTIEEASKMLDDKITFGYNYARINPEDLDFSTFDFSMVPEIMQSNIAKNRASVFHELKCVFSLADTDKLEMVMDNFFRDASYRVTLIDKLVNIDVQLKEIGYSRRLLEETKEAFDDVTESLLDSLPMQVKTSFTDLVFNLYQQQIDTIMESLYELSKAYEFISLWDFHALDKYKAVHNLLHPLYIKGPTTTGCVTNHSSWCDTSADILASGGNAASTVLPRPQTFLRLLHGGISSEVMANYDGNLDSLQGILHLKILKQNLEDERRMFLDKIQSTSGPTSHEYVLFKEFNQASLPDMFEDLHTKGVCTIRVDLDPDDLSSIGCERCFNQRLDAFYVELLGEQQGGLIPPELYVIVAHMGDSYFLLPANDGRKKVIYLQQSPVNPEGGNIMSFNTDHPIHSKADPELAEKFSKHEHQICPHVDSSDFFTQKPCKSPYSTFVITVPRSPTYTCTLDDNKKTSGTNCKDLDFTKFTSIRVYMKVNSWSGYPIQPDE